MDFSVKLNLYWKLVQSFFSGSFSDEEYLTDIHSPRMEDISRGICIPFVLPIARKVRERYTNGVPMVRETGSPFLVYIP